MKRFSTITGLSVTLMLTAATPLLAAKPKSAQPVDNTPVVTPDTTPPPIGTAAPSGTVQVAAPGSAPAAPAPYAIPVGGVQAQASSPAAPRAPVEAPVPQGPPEPPVMLRAEQCLRANVERVVRLEASAKLATDLLLADVCSDEVDAGSLYIRNVEALSHFSPESERGRAGLSMPHVDLETGQIVSPPNVDISSALAADAAGRNGTMQIAPNLRKYAADLVLNEALRRATAAAHPPQPAKKGH